MPIQIGNTDINQLLNDSRIGMGNQFNPVEAIYSGGIGFSSNIWTRSILGVITPITISDKLGLGTSTFIGSERLRVSGETNTDILRTQTGYLDTLRLRNNSSYLAITAPVTTSRTITFQDKDGIVALLSDTQSLPNYALVSTYTQTNSAITGAVTNSHTHANKALLDTYNQTNSDLTSAVSLKHSHSNKSLLDTYTQSNSDISNAIANSHTHANKTLLDTYDQINADILLAITNQHTHSNKTLLDTYNQTNVDITSAVTNTHIHTNKTLLDTYTQIDVDLADAVTKKHSHTNLTLLETYDQTNSDITTAITNSHTHSNKTILDGIINSGSGTTFLSDAGDYRSVSVAPVGTDTQVIFNDGGTILAGDSGLVFDKTTNLLTAGALQTSSILNIENTTTYLSKNGGNDLVFTDANSGSVTLATLVAGNTNYWTSTTGGILYTNYVGVNNPATLDEALTVNGNIQATYFNSSYLRYKNSNLLLGPNAGDNETGSNFLYIANTDTATPLILGDFLGQGLTLNADVYINLVKRLNFGSSDVYMRRDASNNLIFRDLNANGGTEISLTDITTLTGYALKSDFTSYTSVTSITAANKTTWNKASILTTAGGGTNFLADDGTYKSAGGGVTPTDNILKWDSGASYYRVYTDKTEAGGVSSGGKLYGGTTDPTNSNRLNYDGALVAFQITGRNSGVGYGIRGDNTSSGDAVQATANSGIGVRASSVSGVTAIFNNGSLNTSDIAQFQKNSVNQCEINTSGINLITGATYKINGASLASSELLTGYSATSGTISATDSILQAIQKLGHDQHVPTTVITTNGLLITGQQISLESSSASTNGALTSIDWNTFNNKKPSQAVGLTFNPTNSVLFDRDYQYNSYNVSSNITITANLTGAVALNSSYLTLVGDGTHTVSFSGIIPDANSINFDNTIGVINEVKIYYDGTSAYYNIPSSVQGEPYLETPSTNGFILSSTTTDVRSWVDPLQVSVPSQLGNAGKYLYTDGTNTSWSTVSGGVTPVDGILKWDGTAYNPYSTQSAGKFDNSTTSPVHTNRLNYDGTFYVSSLNIINTYGGVSDEIYIQNNNIGNGINIDNEDAGIGIKITNLSSLSTDIYGLDIENSGTGKGIIINNSSTGEGINILNSSTGTPFIIRNSTNDKFIINNNGLPRYTSGVSNTFVTIPGVLKDFYTDVSTSGTGETDLYSYTIPANVLSNDGDKLIFSFVGETIDSTPILNLYFAGTSHNLGLLTPTLESYVITITRTSSSSCKVTWLAVSDIGNVTGYYQLNSKNWTISNILKLTGQVSNSLYSITLHTGTIEYKPVAIN